MRKLYQEVVARMKRRTIARAIASLALLVGVAAVAPTPAYAADTYHTRYFDFSGFFLPSGSISFNVIVNNRTECLSLPSGAIAGHGNAAPQATVWGCNANPNFQTWTAAPVHCDQYADCDAFYLYNY